jgi:hypothetical protein
MCAEPFVAVYGLYMTSVLPLHWLPHVREVGSSSGLHIRLHNDCPVLQAVSGRGIWEDMYLCVSAATKANHPDR